MNEDETKTMNAPVGSHENEPVAPPRHRRPLTAEEIARAEAASPTVGIGVDDLAALYTLDSVKFLGPQVFKELHGLGLRPSDACRDPNLLPTKGKRGDKIRAQLRVVLAECGAEFRDRAVRQLLAAEKYNARIVTYGHSAYPRNVYDSNHPAPLLYVRGAIGALENRRSVACVGSRGIRPPYTEWEGEFVRHATEKSFAIISGFATGADRIGHEQSWRSGGETICVMPSGLDRPFPPENRDLWENLLKYERAAMVTESPFGTSASSLTLRKRNKLIVAFSKGVLVVQSSTSGGAMNAYRFALEQKKPVASFLDDGSADTSGNKIISEDASGFAMRPDKEAFDTWLAKLSSSI